MNRGEGGNSVIQAEKKAGIQDKQAGKDERILP